MRSRVGAWLCEVLHVWRWFLFSGTDGKSTLNVHVDGGSQLHWFNHKTILFQVEDVPTNTRTKKK